MNKLFRNIWLAVIAILIALLFVVSATKADPTTAPISNIVRILIDDPNNYTCGTGFILKRGTVLNVVEKKREEPYWYGN